MDMGSVQLRVPCASTHAKVGFKGSLISQAHDVHGMIEIKDDCSLEVCARVRVRVCRPCC